jgi:hypothetical protein
MLELGTPDWAATLRTLLNTSSNWTGETNPAFASLEFPYKTSKDYLTHPARAGKNLIWCMEMKADPEDSDDAELSYAQAQVDVFCYSMAVSDLEADILAAQTRTKNMRNKARNIIKANESLAGAVRVIPGRSYELHEFNPRSSPCYFAEVLTVKVLYVES